MDSVIEGDGDRVNPEGEKYLGMEDPSFRERVQTGSDIHKVDESKLKQRKGDQPLPLVNETTDIQQAVIRDIEERREVGKQRYGTALQGFNGRSVVRDLYEELLDGVMYAKQMRKEQLVREYSVVNHIWDAMLEGGSAGEPELAICEGISRLITDAFLHEFGERVDDYRLTWNQLASQPGQGWLVRL